jgi:seryl-tRNA synthetase
VLDIKEMEKDLEGTRAALRRRGDIPGLDAVFELSEKRKELIARVQSKQEERNAINQKMKGASKEDIDARRQEMRTLSTNIKEDETVLRALEEELNEKLLSIPNLPAADVPDGNSEEDNLEIKKVGTPSEFKHAVLDHVDIGEKLGIIDFERAAKVSGSRFAYLKGAGARLNRALISYMVDFHSNLGDVELWTPYLVNGGSMTGTGQLPKFAEDMFCIPRGEAEPFYLIPTAEVSLTNYFADEILEEEELPQRMIAHTPCFRAEAGSAGKDTRGLIRQHQFDKVEMVRFAAPEQADAELQNMVDRASQIMTDLELPHRIVLLCAGDLGANAERTYDLEVWIPSQDTYREISSCSVFGSYQARRARIRYRPKAPPGQKKRKPRPVVTLNGSGLAVGRTLVAILENHQQADGSVHIPKKLQPYFGADRIG